MARGPCPSPRPTCLGRLSSGSRTPHRSGTFCPALPSATPALPQHSAEAPFSPQSSLTLHSRSRLPLCGFAGPCPPPSPRHECHQLIPRATSSLFVKFGPQMDTFLESHVSADAPHVPRLFKAPRRLLVLFFAFIYCYHFSLPPTDSDSSVFKINPFNPLSSAYETYIMLYILDLCQWRCVINLSLVPTFFFHFTLYF